MREILTLPGLLAMKADEAAAMLHARLRDPTGAHDAELLVAWLEHDAEHPLAWDRAEAMLALFEDADDEEDDLLRSLREEALAARPAASELQAQPAERSRWNRWAGAAAAAAVLLVTAVSVDRFAFPGPERPGSGQLAGSTYRTGVGDIREIALVDGTRMTVVGQFEIEP